MTDPVRIRRRTHQRPDGLTRRTESLTDRAPQSNRTCRTDNEIHRRSLQQNGQVTAAAATRSSDRLCRLVPAAPTCARRKRAMRLGQGVVPAASDRCRRPREPGLSPDLLESTHATVRVRASRWSDAVLRSWLYADRRVLTKLTAPTARLVGSDQIADYRLRRPPRRRRSTSR